MRYRPTTRALVVGLLVAGLAGSVLAHPRARHHVHKSARSKAVIVVGTPRPAKKVVVLNGVAHGTIDVNVKPRSTEVWIDGDLRGTADAFDGFPGKLHLKPGVHKVRLVTPDGESVAREVRVRPGVEINLGLDLR